MFLNCQMIDWSMLNNYIHVYELLIDMFVSLLDVVDVNILVFVIN